MPKTSLELNQKDVVEVHGMDMQPIDADDVGGQIGQIDGPDFAGRIDCHMEDGGGYIRTRTQDETQHN